MKRIIIFSLLLSMASCSEKTQENTSTIDMLKEQRDSIAQVQASLSMALLDIEKQIALLDTSAESKYSVVSSMQITPQKFEHFFQVYGTVEADRNANIFPETQGNYKEIRVVQGSQVKKGEVLAVIDTEVLSNNIKELEKRLELATTLYERRAKLWEQQIGSEMQYLEAKNNKESLEKSLSTLRSQVAKANVTAPFDGIVDEVFPKLGEMANPAIPLMRLVNLSKVYIKADVPEIYISKVKAGVDARVEFLSLDEVIETKINSVGSFINPGNRTFKIQLNIENTKGNLKPNLLANIFIKDFEMDSAVVLPNNAILQDSQGNEFVFVLEQNGNTKIARKVSVKSIMSNRTESIIESGLIGNEEIVLKGARSLKDNEKVRVRNS